MVTTMWVELRLKPQQVNDVSLTCNAESRCGSQGDSKSHTT